MFRLRCAAVALKPLPQGGNEVCGIRDQRGGIRDQKGRIWSHSPGIRDHKPGDRDQQVFEGLGIRLYHFSEIRDQNLLRFWNQGSENWVKKWDQRLKTIPCYDPITLNQSDIQLSFATLF